MSKHPGKTKAQQRALDEIGCGNHRPFMAKSTRDALLREGLIVEIAPARVPVGIGNLCMNVQRFDMTKQAHMQWCDYQSEQPGGEE